jgi:N-terminal domain of (some) glycogen debranching enzymes
MGSRLFPMAIQFLLSSPDGTIAPGSRQGLFDHDTRVLSTYELLLDGVVPSLDTSGLIDSDHWTARLTVPVTSAPQYPGCNRYFLYVAAASGAERNVRSSLAAAACVDLDEMNPISGIGGQISAGRIPTMSMLAFPYMPM